MRCHRISYVRLGTALAIACGAWLFAFMPKAAAQQPLSELPPAVAELHDALLRAAISGDPENLRYPMELNELPPVLGPQEGSSGGTTDPVEFAKSVSGDDGGREILAIIVNLLIGPYAVETHEGEEPVFVWPAIATANLAELSPAQQVQLLRLVRPDESRKMIATGKYTFWRIGISQSGVWHDLRKEN